MSFTDPTTNIVVPDKPANLVSSSSIMGYSYDDVNYILDVWYHSKSGKQSLYRYFLVYPVTLAQVFNSGSGLGLKARNTLKAFRYQKLR